MIQQVLDALHVGERATCLHRHHPKDLGSRTPKYRYRTYLLVWQTPEMEEPKLFVGPYLAGIPAYVENDYVIAEGDRVTITAVESLGVIIEED